jgi:hypothetical protein
MGNRPGRVQASVTMCTSPPTGTSGAPALWANRAAPDRKQPTVPSRLRVPSGYTMTRHGPPPVPRPREPASATCTASRQRAARTTALHSDLSRCSGSPRRAGSEITSSPTVPGGTPSCTQSLIINGGPSATTARRPRQTPSPRAQPVAGQPRCAARPRPVAHPHGRVRGTRVRRRHIDPAGRTADP